MTYAPSNKDLCRKHSMVSEVETYAPANKDVCVVNTAWCSEEGSVRDCWLFYVNKDRLTVFLTRFYSYSHCYYVKNISIKHYRNTERER